jgi:hypothetical protein
LQGLNGPRRDAAAEEVVIGGQDRCLVRECGGDRRPVPLVARDAASGRGAQALVVLTRHDHDRPLIDQQPDTLLEAFAPIRAGQRTREGQSRDRIADELRPAIEALIDTLDRYTTAAAD